MHSSFIGRIHQQRQLRNKDKIDTHIHAIPRARTSTAVCAYTVHVTLTRSVSSRGDLCVDFRIFGLSWLGVRVLGLSSGLARSVLGTYTNCLPRSSITICLGLSGA